MKESAGTLLYRMADNGPQVLLVHPSGNYNRRAPWSIPKGLPDPDESHESAACRETAEETGVIAGPLFDLDFVDYKRSRKRIFCFGGQAPLDAEPFCASWEVDRAEFVALDEARERLHPDQLPFLDRLVNQLSEDGSLTS